MLSRRLRVPRLDQSARQLRALCDEAVARGIKLSPIASLMNTKFDVRPHEEENYGPFKAKLSQDYLDRIRTSKDGKLVLVTAMSPSRPGAGGVGGATGEGKTCTSIGLCDALNLLGKRSIVCLREPSLGPVFGMKGGATGGGFAQVAPMQDINLHFTGDLHAVTAANNLLAALVDNHIYWRNSPLLDPRRVEWRRVVDMNDRSLRNTVIGLGKVSNGFVREDGFDITAASEIMAILCLASSYDDLNIRLSKIIVGYSFNGKPITAGDIQAHGAVAALLRDAMRPNVVQTLEQNIAMVHGGPFGNIAHGCSSLIATRAALKMSDIVVTEAGFGADLGAEKFFNVKCRKGGLQPTCAVVVVTVGSLKYHGGWHESDDGSNVLSKGMCNLYRHVQNIGKFGVPSVVAVNVFPGDSEEDVKAVVNRCAEQNIRAVVSTHHANGGRGAKALAQVVASMTEEDARDHSTFKFLYRDEDSLQEKIETIAREIYRANEVVIEATALAKLRKYERLGFDRLPICMAKTQYSFNDDPAMRGAPTDHSINVKDVRLSAGAEFVIAFTGKISTMPGLPRNPPANRICVDGDGNILGLSR